MYKIAPTSSLCLVLQYITQYIDKQEPEKYTFKAILKETGLEEKILASIVSDLQLSGLIIYSKEKPGYYLPTLEGEKKAESDYLKLLKWIENNESDLKVLKFIQKALDSKTFI